MGSLFLNYERALKINELKKFFSQNGIPVTGKRKKESTPGEELEATWDSPCEYKKNKKAIYDRVQTFRKNFNASKVQFPNYLLLTSNNEIKKINASSDDSVLGVVGNKLVFNRLVHGVYYQYQVDPKGKFRLIMKKISQY